MRHRVHHRTGQAVDVADARRQAHGNGSAAYRHPDGGRGPDHQEGSGHARGTGAAGPASPSAVRQGR